MQMEFGWFEEVAVMRGVTHLLLFGKGGGLNKALSYRAWLRFHDGLNG